MQIIKYPAREQWAEILKRPTLDFSTLFENVEKILSEVRTNGDSALRKFSNQFDNVDVAVLEVTAEEIEEADKMVSVELKQAIEMARRNTRRSFHFDVFVLLL